MSMAKILVVDDDPLTAEMLRAFLRIMGHEATEANDGNEARRRVTYDNPDAILLDYMLPDINGLDLCREFRADQATAHLPIIMISAYAPPLTEAAFEAGANDYLTKPINISGLRSALTKAGIT